MIDFAVYFIAIFLGTILLVAAWALVSYNRLRALESRCQQAANDIDVQLKQRSDLIPNLVATVQGFVKQETGLLDMLRDVQMSANAQSSINNNTKRNSNISNNLNSVFASLDGIPELRSNSHYVSLRSELLNIEDRIAAARRFLNMAAAEFNAKRAQFPGSLFAGAFKVPEQSGYSLGSERIFHEDAPVVSL